jgi:NAD(P)-dependent dehydrogenase (short-subunit alcohol dehydrogenase family)
MRRLDGKVAIVTGAGQGLGYGIGKRFSEEGAHVVVAEINRETVGKAAEDFSCVGPEALAYPVDIGDIYQTRQMVADVIARFGRIDILVNNAGLSQKATLLEITPEQWDQLQRVNVRGLLFCTQAVAQQMIAQVPDRVRQAREADRSYGKILNLASIAGRRGRADAIHYSVSKASVITITQAAAMELAPYGINVNAICPSVVPTPLWDKLDQQVAEREGWPRGEFYKRRVARIPLKRAGTVEEIAAITTFLCSNEADYITAQTYNVDGGSEMN